MMLFESCRLVTALVVAAGAAADTDIVLTWKSVPGAQAYQIQISEDARFRSIVIDDRIHHSEYRWPAFPAESHYWRVRSLDDEGRPGRWSRVGTIVAKVRPPSLPEDPRRRMVAGGAIPLAFEEPVGAVHYRVEVAPDDTFERPLVVELTDRSPARVAVDRPGLYWWRVQAFDVHERASAFSAARTVRIVLPGPEPVHPESSATVMAREDEPIALQWTEVPRAAEYRVTVWMDAEEVWTAAARALRAEVPGLKPGVYAWGVTAIDDRGQAGKPGPRAELFVQLPAPTLRAPPAGSVHDTRRGSVDLSWEGSTREETFELALAADPDFVDSRPIDTGAEPRATVEISREGTYWWRVRGRSAKGPDGAWSSTRHFVVRRPATRQAVVRVEATELIADGVDSTAIQVELFDETGERVETSTLSIEAEMGRVELVDRERGRYHLRYTGPSRLTAPKAEDRITIEDREFTATAQIDLRSPGPFERMSLAVVGGWATNFGGLSSPTAIAELTYRLGWPRSAVHVGLRGGYHRLAQTVDVPPLGDWTATLDTVPFSIWAGYAWRFRPWSVVVGAGPSLQLNLESLEDRTSFHAEVGAAGLASLGYGLGPGSLILDVSGGGWTFSSERQVEAQPLLLTIGLGYRLRL